MPESWNGSTVTWITGNLDVFLEPVKRFISENNIRNFQIVASEFWCNRRIHGCEEYFRDLINIYNKNNWHWGFWQFRPDGSYTGLDYELNDAPDSGLFIVKCNREDFDPEILKQRFDNPMWSILSAGLKGESMNIPYNEAAPVPVSEEEIKRLISELYNEEWIIRETAAGRLAKLGKDAYTAIPHLLLLLEDEEWLVRRSAIYALLKTGALRDNTIRKKIKELQNDQEEHVRIEANLALGYVEDSKR